MSEIDDGQLIELRRNIVALVGKCILKLQNYELGLKRFLATSEFSVTAGEPSTNLHQRRQRYSGMTLGQLIKEFTGSYISLESPEGSDEETEANGKEAHYSPEFQLQFSIKLNEDEYITFCESLSTLVTLRNEIVHQFLSKHALQNQSGCLDAEKYLTEALDLIDHHVGKLNEFFEFRATAGRYLIQSMESGDLYHYMTFGFIPGQPIDWTQTRAVELLKSAEAQFQIDGWTGLLPAVEWIRSEAPKVSPKAYDCSSWREILHTSSLFEIRKQRQANLPTKTLYRSR
ncbi:MULTISPECIES: OST-HTH/LOTUS domain-containing protein [Marinobacter]|uniref:OST-HTH/LOTUS domain-containing protein n=1 Tax=Marinobacter TaxID=2742 RepID=UPI00124473F5|nr:MULTISPECIES: OST-HTH/LOTUS domain-containing protein [Marinobacter]MBL3556875.1 hypothetical protein [Marinobacter sp. JB05H06]